MKEGWEYKKLGEVCDFEGGSQPPKSEWLTQQLDGYVRMLQIRDFTKSRSCEIEYVKMSKKLRLCKSDDILIGRYGASVGKILTGLEGAYNVAIIKSIPNESVISKKYIRRFFESGLFQNHLIKICNARAAQAGFSKEDIYDVQIPVPPLPDQQRIVTYLDAEFAKIEALKANAEKQLQAAKDLFQAALKELLTPKEGWVEKKLGDLSLYYNGLTYKPSDVSKQGFLVLRSSNIQNNKLSLEDQVRVSVVVNDKLKIHKGDIIMCSRNGSKALIGKVAIIPEEYEDLTFGTFMMVIKSKFNPFLYYFFLSERFKGQIWKGEANMINQITRYMLDDVFVCLPTNIDEQKRIVARLDALSVNVKALQTNYTETITLCNDLKQALLKKVFG